MHSDNADEYSTPSFLFSLHTRSASEQIVGPDINGAFRESLLAPLLGDALPIVVDANILRNDIGRTCRSNSRTILITGANTRAFRLYCAEHVVAEVTRHSARWARDLDVDGEAFLGVWQTSYVPLLRQVSTARLESTLLANERERIEHLRNHQDPDDVPSVVLALAMGAYFLSEDKAAYEAVHGTSVEAADLRRWLDTLRGGSDAAALEQVQSLSLAMPLAAAVGLWNAGRWIYARSPIALAAIGLVSVAGIVLTPWPRNAWDGVKMVSSRIADEVLFPQAQASARVRSALPPFPPWGDLTQEVSRDSALTRACVYRLARSRKCLMRARDLAADLPPLAIGQAAPRVGKILGSKPCFYEPYKGTWQLGRPIGT